MPPTTMRSFLRVARVFPEVSSGKFQTQSRAPFSSTGSSSSNVATTKLPGGTPGEASDQAVPLGPYYESILINPQPVPNVKPEEPPTSSPKPPRTTAKKTPPPPNKKPSNKGNSNNTKATATTSSAAAAATSAPEPTAQEKARIIFGSRLAGPIERAERLAALRDRSRLIAGVLVPPRPEEPDNCCMSGCVNCVWDRYRDDMEEWLAASLQAEKALQARRRQGAPAEVLSGSVSAAASMDDDGGGSETNWQVGQLQKADRPKIAKDLWDDALYKNIPVGIREFMKQEKRLKEKHMREGTFGA